ncbi:hypothetical protein RGQ15_10275 [Paracoccus sp. MBLB3053]|uniref:DUF4231 domain-containing protein n=1 Tax=Paracoccus aurantius TaxID=3073814 RepID=A0ABU2HSD5_9RHOB|nr:hypothetical protein [Paracoccus sp. MBLB3053]MDS9467951.1 hypothetical protein [Paracoccus sp. MBLB3053]
MLTLDAPEDPPFEIPPEVLKRANDWRFVFKFAHRVHYVLGLVGVVCGALTPLHWEHAKYFGVVAGLCAAILAFVQPMQIYRRYAIAWRILDSAILRAKSGKLSLENLLDAVEQGERQLSSDERPEPSDPK